MQIEVWSRQTVMDNFLSQHWKMVMEILEPGLGDGDGDLDIDTGGW